jgi:hypothetical protein
VVEQPLHQLPVLPRLEVPLLLKSQPLRKKRRKKKVGCFPRCHGFCSQLAEKEESDEDMGFGLFD